MADGWNPIDHPVNHIEITGKPSPGHAVVGGAAIKRKWDERGGIGIEGSTIVLMKLELVSFDVKIRLYTTADWAAWDAWKPLIHKVPNRYKPLALDIYHPILAELKIKAVVVEAISQFVEVEDSGVWEVTITFKTYRKRRPLPLVKPEGSEAPKPQDPFEQMMVNNSAEISKLVDRFAGNKPPVTGGVP